VRGTQPHERVGANVVQTALVSTPQPSLRASGGPAQLVSAKQIAIPTINRTFVLFSPGAEFNAMLRIGVELASRGRDQRFERAVRALPGPSIVEQSMGEVEA
jgi:hypothetical protein